ncbi:unnamed protein product [Orchesella dallaii]|uniref:Uncharacterized protein n=1 Tax=Orchesella dallaii TaxID=48710 RepID=A0ABP1QVK8_9HEXA
MAPTTTNKFLVGVLIGIASVLACCAGDKDLLRVPSASSPVFSSSIDSIPLQSGASNNQQSLYKNPNLIHSSASASASANHNVDQGRNQGGYSPSQGGYAPSQGGYELGGSSDTSYHSSSNLQNFIPYEQPPQQTPPQQQASLAASATSVEHSSSSSNSGSNNYGAPHQQPSYTYYYQHYPSSTTQGGGGGWSGSDGGSDGGIFGDLGHLQLPSLGGGFGGSGLGGGLGGLGGLKGLGVLGVIAKGILAVKPFLILGLLILIALPILFLLLPIPIVTITGQAGQVRSGRSSQIATYLTQLSGKVLNSEECLERIICKLPQAPEKYQTRAKLIWDEYGMKLVKNERVSRGLEAYFEGSSQKNKNLKCNQKFKCSNKYL